MLVQYCEFSILISNLFNVSPLILLKIVIFIFYVEATPLLWAEFHLECSSLVLPDKLFVV